MIAYFNNCHGRDYKLIYGSGVFFDLNTVGIQATKATDLSAGQQCIVVAPGAEGQIVFSWFSFLREDQKPDENGNPCRVLYGDFIKSLTLLKKVAAHDNQFSAFFDKNGHFKRQSVIHWKANR